jgi:HAD superfamily hydrolase (TIGR01549 family)
VALPAAVVFDLDDTLHDAAGLEAEMWAGLCAAIGEELPAVDLDEMRARWLAARDTLYAEVLSGRFSIDEYRRAHLAQTLLPWGAPSDALTERTLALRHAQLDRARFVAHATELLAQLRAEGVRTGLLTNGPSWMQRHKLEVLGLERQLDAVAISEEIGAAKPDPAAFASALELLGAAPEETVMVGDNALLDVRGALDAGFLGAVWIAADDDARESPPGALRVAGLAEVPAALERIAEDAGAGDGRAVGR